MTQPADLHDRAHAEPAMGPWGEVKAGEKRLHSFRPTCPFSRDNGAGVYECIHLP